MLNQFFGENGVATVYMYATPIHITLILFEMFYSYKHREHRYAAADTITNLYLAILNFGLDLILKAIGIGVMFYFYQYRIFDLNTVVWWYWIGVFLLQDFAYYVHHVIDHKSRLFWQCMLPITILNTLILLPVFAHLYFNPCTDLCFFHH